MISEINTLAQALMKMESKLQKEKEKRTVKTKDLRQELRESIRETEVAEDELEKAGREVGRAREAEGRMAEDLRKQHKIAKDSLRALENVSSKYDQEKRQFVQRLDQDKEEMLKREMHRSDVKLNSLKALN